MPLIDKIKKKKKEKLIVIMKEDKKKKEEKPSIAEKINFGGKFRSRKK